MAEDYFPFDSGNGANSTEDRWRKMADLWISTGVVRGLFSDFNAFGDASGMNVKLPAGAAWIKGHYYENDAQTTWSIAASHATQERYDRLVIRVNFTTNVVTPAIVQGTNAAVGTATLPALTQNTSIWEIAIAKILVSPTVTNIAANKVTTERTYSGPFRASTWTSYSPTIVTASAGNTTGISGFSITRAEYQIIGNRCYIEVQAVVGINGAAGAGGIFVGAPVTPKYSGVPMGADAMNALARSRTAIAFSANWIDVYPPAGVTWAQDSVQRNVFLSGSYQIADGA